MLSRNAITIFYVAASLSSAIALAKDEGFRYHVTTGQCINAEGELGLNKAHFGECGDIPGIKLFRKRKIKKAELSYANLKGIQLNGLDLSTKDLTGADLTGANLIGTKLTYANLQGANLAKAKFNDETVLPFSVEEAVERGMLNIDFVGDRPVNDSIVNEILTSQDLSALQIELAEIRRPHETYHERLKRVFNSAEALNAEQLETFMVAAFSQQQIVNSLFDQITANQNAERPDNQLEERLRQEYQLQIEWSSIANAILLEGLRDKMKINELSFEQALKLASLAVPNSSYNSTADHIFNLLTANFEITGEEELKELNAAAIMSGAELNAANSALKILELRGAVTVNSLLAGTDEFYGKRPNLSGFFIELGIDKLDSLNASEILQLAAINKDRAGLVVNRGIEKVSSLNAQEALRLLSISAYSTNDKILTKFFELNDEVSYVDFTALVQKAYQKRNELITANINDVKDLTPEQAVNIIQIASYGGKDSAALAYLANQSELTTANLIAIARSAYQKGNQILTDEQHKLSDLNAANVASLASVAAYSGKDSVIERYLKELNGKATTDEMIALARAAYQKGNSFLSSYLKSISDLNPSNVAKMAGVAGYSGKDAVVGNYLSGFDTKMSSDELIALARNSYQNGNTVLTNLSKLNDLSIDNVTKIMSVASYSTKDTIMKNYLEDYTTSLTAKDLIKIASAAHNQGTALLLATLDKVAPMSLEAALELAGVLTYNNKNTVINYYISKQASLTSASLLELARASHNIGVQILLENLSKISDLSHANAITLTSNVTYNNKNTILSFYLSKITELTTAQLIDVANNSYNKMQEYITGNLSKVSDLTVNNALSLKGAYAYSSLDQYLLLALEHVTDLNQQNLVQLSNSAYRAQNTILTRGMEILLGQNN